MFKHYLMRMGLIAGMALTVFAVGSLKNFLDPPSGVQEVDYRATARSNSKLAAGLYDPVMAVSYAELKSEGALGKQLDSEAKMTFPSPSGDVVLTRSDIQLLNARYEALATEIESEPSFEDLKREQLASEGWGENSAP